MKDNDSRAYRWARSLWYVCVAAVLCFAVFTLIAYPRRYDKEIEEACRTYGVERALVRAVIRCESGFRPRARSYAGAVGLMQLMPSTAAWVATRIGQPRLADDLTDERASITLGTAYLKYLTDKFPLADALAAYNAGEGNVAKWRAEGREEYPYAETREYVKKVLRAKKVYEVIGGV